MCGAGSASLHLCLATHCRALWAPATVLAGPGRESALSARTPTCMGGVVRELSAAPALAPRCVHGTLRWHAHDAKHAVTALCCCTSEARHTNRQEEMALSAESGGCCWLNHASGGAALCWKWCAQRYMLCTAQQKRTAARGLTALPARSLQEVLPPSMLPKLQLARCEAPGPQSAHTLQQATRQSWEHLLRRSQMQRMQT
jgi:hypothetical protein